MWQVPNIHDNLFAQMASLKTIQLNEIWFTFDLIDLPLQGISAMEVYDFSAQREECLGNGMIAM